MPRLTAIPAEQAPGKAKDLLASVQKQLGVTPNLMRTLANSPAALDAYLGFGAALGQGVLEGKVREQIALTVAEANSCDYCLAAHTTIGKLVGLSADELAASRSASSWDPKINAALKFARLVVAKRGLVTDSDVSQLRQAGHSEAEVVEIIANVALNIFTNYFNHIAGTEVDFPKVTPAAGKVAA